MKLKRKSLGMREQSALLTAVDLLLISADDPANTNTVMCGRVEVESLRHLHKELADKFYRRQLPQNERP